jgi:hypothetical protein
MIELNASTLLEHKASWHDDRSLCKRNAELIARDVAATKEARFREAIRMKLGKVPPLVKLRNRLEIFRREDTKPEPVNYLALDGEIIAVFTDPRSRVKNCRYIVSWHWKCLVDNSGN